MTLPRKRLFFRLTFTISGVTLLLLCLPGRLEAAGGILLFLLLSFRLRLVVWVETRAFRYAECEICGTVFDLVDTWACGCGHIKFHHAFNGCKRCDTDFPYVACPQCGVSVDLR